MRSAPAPFYVSNLAVALVLALAANTSFGGLPVLLSLLAKDHRLPHLFYLRAERPIYRYGIVALALAAALLLVAVNARRERLIPLFTIGVFIGFTISQVGLVRHWLAERPSRWRRARRSTGRRDDDRDRGRRLAGDEVPRGRMDRDDRDPPADGPVLAHRDLLPHVAARAAARQTPPHSRKRESTVIIPTSSVDLLTERALSVALSLGEHGRRRRGRR